MTSLKRLSVRLLLGLLLAAGLFATGTATATAIKVTPNADLTSPYRLTLGDNGPSYIFSSRNTLFN
ncbi:hypothetical protein, partial [Salinisphaera sp.]|uniref:hypothetical protein n=1 Tax=Salinisphaera sp. TaxID=1914330 RepID=UPI002D7709E4